jgi:type 1 glutamine amidotransferase
MRRGSVGPCVAVAGACALMLACSADRDDGGADGGGAGVAITGGYAGADPITGGAGGGEPLGPMQVLLFTEVSGWDEAHDQAPWDHYTRDTVAGALGDMSAEKGFALERADQSDGYFTSEGLATYDVVIFASTTGAPLDEAERTAFEGYVRSGGGFVGIHAAADCHYQWPWYGGLVGAYFLTHPMNPNVAAATVIREDGTHAATLHLDASFPVTDEWYTFRDLNVAGLHVLLTLDESSYLVSGQLGVFNQPCEMGYHPIAWYHEYDGGRAFYTGFGHTEELYAQTWFREHLWGGLQYAAGRLEP